MRPARLLPLVAAALLTACQPAAPNAPAADPAADRTGAPVMPADAPPQEEPVDEAAPALPAQTPATQTPVSAPLPSGVACRDEIGATASARLVERCRMVSPATRPPCNAANPCAMIREHIDWACAKWGPGETKPAECAA